MHKMTSMRQFSALCVFTATVVLAGGAPIFAATPVLDAMQQELERSFKVLSKQSTPAYFLSYEITEERVTFVQTSFGAVTGNSIVESRTLDIDLRVGDHDLDNTHPTRERFRFRPGPVQIPVSDLDALRNALWFETDKKYKDAVEQLTKVKTDVQVKVQEEDQSPDFSAEEPETFVDDLVSLEIDRQAWEKKLKRYSAPFAGSEHIYSSQATLGFAVVTRWYVNSEGAAIRTSEPRARLSIFGMTKAEDGMELPRFESFFAFDPSDLPGDDTVLETIRQMVDDLGALRAAPVADPYAGPAILSGRASGVFFHEILGHRVEGHRQRSEQDAQTFKEMLGESVLPETFSVIFDPTRKRIGSTDLSGFYEFDNQGVKARRVEVIADGVLREFLMSRTPITGFSHSNGHGRKQPGFAPVSRQSNLLVEVDDPHSSEALRDLLVSRLKAEGKEFGLYFEDVQGGFTFTGRGIPNAFNVMPVMVYRIYTDGRQELVRGVDLIGTPLTTFSKIAAGSDEIGVFNGICGAESGGVPVSAVSPSVLVSQIEVQRKDKSQDRIPLLPAPPTSVPTSIRNWEGGSIR